MTKYCPYCGCPLKETSLGRDWCPNCFKVIEEEKNQMKTLNKVISVELPKTPL